MWMIEAESRIKLSRRAYTLSGEEENEETAKVPSRVSASEDCYEGY
jgi:hypothetical protein